MATEVVGQQLSAEQAQELTEEVRREAATLWTKVLDLYEGGAHLALGYRNWRDYWEAEFGGGGARGEQLVRAGRVARALTEAGLPIPANDTVARKLTPVLRRAPQELPDLWSRAVQAHGQPTGRQMEPLVAPYRDAARRSPELSQRVAADYEHRGQMLHRRTQLSHALSDALSAAVGAAAVVDDALEIESNQEVLARWLEDARTAARGLAEIVDKLEAV